MFQIKNKNLNSIIKSTKVNLLDMDRIKLQEFFNYLGEKSFRANQIMKWIYHYYYDNFDLMVNFSKVLRDKLKNIAEIKAPKIVKEKHSIDGTIKWSINIDQQEIETVYIPEINRATLCISSQIGCALKCKFCLTGYQGFSRNLRVSEIIGQIWLITKIIKSLKNIGKHPITNIVIMGMGEPLLNFNNIVTSIKIMKDHFGFGLSKRRITLSTSGIVPALYKLGDKIDISLAISLHAPTNEIRNKIIPINKKYNIESFLSAVRYYLTKSNANKGRVTVEYVMLNNINDNIEHAFQLAKCLENTPSKINLIPWNSFPNSIYTKSSNSRIDRFSKILIKCGYDTFVRKTRGDDINAACGQLAGYVINKIKK